MVAAINENETMSQEVGIVKYDITNAAIAKMEAEYLPLKINGIDDKAGFETVHSARMVVKNHRVAVEKKRKELNSDALAWQRKVNEEAKRITAKLEPIETHLEKEENVVVEEKARIKAEAERIELARVTGIREKIAAMSRMVLGTHGKSAAEIQKMILDFSAQQVTTEEYQEFAIEAAKVATETMEALVSACQSLDKWEQEQAAAKAEAERLSKEREAQEAEAKRLKAERDAIEAEKKAIEKAKTEEALRKEREEIEARAKERAIKELEELHQAQEKERNEREEREAEEAARKEKLKPDKEKLIAYGNALLEVPAPALKHKKAKQHLNEVMSRLALVVDILNKGAEAL